MQQYKGGTMWNQNENYASGRGERFDIFEALVYSNCYTMKI